MKKVLLKLDTIIKALIFDFDGVLINSPLESIHCLQKTIKAFGLAVPDLELLKKCWQQEHWNNILNVLETQLGWTTTQKLMIASQYQEALVAIRHTAPVGIRSSLAILKKQKLAMTIVSSRGVDSLIKHAGKTKLNLGLFNYVQASDLYKFNKPDPRVFQPSLELFKNKGIRSEEVVVVGDTVTFDLMAARNHVPPLKFIGVASGVCEKEDFLQAGVAEELIIPNINGVVKALSYFN